MHRPIPDADLVTTAASPYLRPKIRPAIQSEISDTGMNLSIWDALLRHYIEIGPKGCGAVVTHHGKVAYEGYAGYADAERGVPRSGYVFTASIPHKGVHGRGRNAVIRKGLVQAERPHWSNTCRNSTPPPGLVCSGNRSTSCPAAHYHP